MHPRRWRPVAALTLALVAAPFLAATAVAAQAGTPTEKPARSVVVSISWLADTKATIHKVLQRIEVLELAHAEPVAPPPAAELAPPARPAPPPPVTDPTTWVWPGNGPITSYFGARWGRMHQGVDIDAAYGSTVVAAQAGTVTLAGWGQRGYGLVVHIDHGSALRSTYSHLSAVSVSSGQVVERGQPIGAVGATGSVTAAHLHYEVHYGGVPRNPTMWLTGPGSTAGNPG
jgi:murein DD-endopeptidase MepM/ murein hydrolase activator NlpD